MAKAMKSGKAKKVVIPLVRVHKSLDTAAKKLANVSDPKAQALLKAINDFTARSHCPQLMVFRFSA